MNAGGHSHQGLGFRYYDKQGAGALPGGLLPMKTPSGRGENVPAIRGIGVKKKLYKHQKKTL